MRTFTKVALFTFFLILIPYQIFNEYSKTCPNKEFLSWDGDLRAVKTIHLAESIRNFSAFSFAFHLFDAPTWPTFRNLIESIILYNRDGTFAVEKIIYFSIFTSYLLLLWIFYFIHKEVKNIFEFLILISFLFLELYLSKPLLLYSFSAMLEIQGALLFSICIYYLTQLYSESYEIEKNLRWKLFISSFLLFQTKYPYGYLLILTILIFHMILFFPETIFFISRYLIFVSAGFKKNYRWILISLFLFALVCIPNSLLKGKTKNYLKYILVILVCLDFYMYIFRETKELLNLGYKRILLICKWILLPILFFALIHPDRFSSSSGTLNHIQSEGHFVGEVIAKDFDYYTVFIRAFQDSIRFANIFLLLSLLSVAFGYLKFRQNRIIPFHFLSNLFILITVFILTFLTSNHQARHIYHILPAFLLGSVFFFREDFKYFNFLKYIFLISLVVLLIFQFYREYKSSFQNRELCFSGKNLNDYFTPRFIYKEFQNEKNLQNEWIVLNGLNPLHVNKADTELVLNKLAYETKTKVKFDLKRLNQYRNFIGKDLFFISDTCNESLLSDLQTHLLSLNSSFKVGKEFDSNLKKEVYVLRESIGSLKLVEENKFFLKDEKFSTLEGCLQIRKFIILD
jgi:hypothetical protein